MAVIRTSLPGAVDDARSDPSDMCAAGADVDSGTHGTDGVPTEFHPAVAAWFRRRFPGGATEPQRRAWPRILSGEDVLVASPTGSGKTLTGFLVAIDAAFRTEADPTPVVSDGAPPRGPGVIYISPLRALAVDVEENLQAPLEGIADEAERLGLTPPRLTVAVRPAPPPGGRGARD